MPPASPSLSTSVTPLGGTSYRITLGNLTAVSGTVQVTVSVTDGVNTTSQAFNMTVTNTAPTLQPVASPVAFSPAVAVLPTITLTGNDPDAADIPGLTYGAKVYFESTAFRAYQLTQTYGLLNPKPAREPALLLQHSQAKREVLRRRQQHLVLHLADGRPVSIHQWLGYDAPGWNLARDARQQLLSESGPGLSRPAGGPIEHIPHDVRQRDNGHHQLHYMRCKLRRHIACGRHGKRRRPLVAAALLRRAAARHGADPAPVTCAGGVLAPRHDTHDRADRR